MRPTKFLATTPLPTSGLAARQRLALGGLALSALMLFFGGPVWGGFTAGVLAMFGYMHVLQMQQLDGQRRAQENLTHFMHSAGTPEDIAQLKGATDVAGLDLYAFLESIKTSYGGESSRGTARLASDDQVDPVSPGVALTLSHDVGFWYAKLVLSGETGRQFLPGGYTQWKGRGKTPNEAIEAVLKKCGASRQKQMIEQYAHRLVSESETQ